MTFNPLIPQPNDDPTASQSDLLGNFGKLNADWLVNHIPLTSGGNNGFHKMVQFPNVLLSDPSVTGQQSVVYPKLGPDSLPALFFKNASNVYQLTKLPISNTGTNWGFISPWGVIFNAGSVASGVTSVTFAQPFTSGQVFSVELTASGSSGFTNYSVVNLTTSGPSVTGFTLSTQANSAFYYFAIGR